LKQDAIPTLVGVPNLPKLLKMPRPKLSRAVKVLNPHKHACARILI